MKPSLFFILLLVCHPGIYAQDQQSATPGNPSFPGDSTLPLRPTPIPRSQPGGFHHHFHLELPMLEINYSIPGRNKNLLDLPYGMDKFMYPAQNSGAPFLPNYSFRWIAIFYKDKIGIELYSDGFGAPVNMNGFNHYMTAQFPGYYFNTDPSAGNVYNFVGQSLGIAYRIHWRSFILEPKFLLGFESLEGDSSYYYAYLKQQGSNQFTQYSIIQSKTPHRQHSYHGRLLAGHRFHLGKKPTEFELGTQWEYIYSPYSLQVDILQQPYGQPQIDHHLDVKETWRQFNVGVYFKVYLHKWIY